MMLIDMSLGDLKFGPHENIKKSTAATLLRSWPGYTEKGGRFQLKSTIVQWDDLAESEGEILVIDGATSGLSLIIHYLKDVKFLIPNPSFIHYKKILNNFSVNIEDYGLLESWENTILDIKEGINKGAKAIIWSSPNNPTGLVAPTDIEIRVAELCKEHDVFFIDDNVYRDFMIQSKTKHHIKNILGDKYLNIYSFSKSFGLSGVRIGYISGDSVVIGKLTDIQWDLKMSISWISQSIAKNAITYASEFPAYAYKIIGENLQYAIRMFEKNNISFIRPGGGMFICLDIRNSELSSKKFVSLLFDEKNILLSPCSVFGNQGEGFVRISAGIMQDDFKNAIDQILDFYINI